MSNRYDIYFKKMKIFIEVVFGYNLFCVFRIYDNNQV